MVNELRSPVVLDATVLSNFTVTDDLELLDVLPAHFVTVEAVTDELRAGVEAGYDHLGRAIDATDVIAVEEKPTSDVLDELSVGEADAILERWITDARYRSPVESVSDVLERRE